MYLTNADIYSMLISDLQEPLSYIPEAMFIGFVFVLMYLCTIMIVGRVTNIHVRHYKVKSFIAWAFVTWFVVVIKYTLLCRTPGVRTGVYLTLFGTFQPTFRGFMLQLENVIMFIPFGILLPFIIKSARNGLICMDYGMFLSIAIEYMQYRTLRGSCEIDDVLMNTIGTVIGWFIFVLIYGIYRISAMATSEVIDNK